MRKRLKFRCVETPSGKHDIMLGVAEIAGDPYPMCCNHRMVPADEDEYKRIRGVLDSVDVILANNDLPILYDLMNYIL